MLTAKEKDEIKAEYEKERKAVNKMYGVKFGVPTDLGCNDDADFDGATNKSDNCAETSNEFQQDDDCDGVGNACDACPFAYDPSQGDCNGNNLGDACEAGSPIPTTYGQVLTLAIPDNAPLGVSTTITVPDAGIILDLDLDLVLSHPRQSDLVVTLSHGKRTATVLYRPGSGQPLAGCSGGGLGYTAADLGTPGFPLRLDDCAPLPVDCYDGAGPGQPGYQGPAHASRLLQAFAGMNKSGLWRLTVSDEALGHTGALQQWGLSFKTLSSVVPRVGFGQTLFATSKTVLGWSVPVDVEFVRGNLAAVSTYGLVGAGSLLAATSIDIGVDLVPPGTGRYYLVRASGSCGSWQSFVGAEPERDLVLP